MRAAHWNSWKRSTLATLAAGAFVFGGVSAAAAQERVNWTDLVNAEIRGNSVEKTRGCDGARAPAPESAGPPAVTCGADGFRASSSSRRASPLAGSARSACSAWAMACAG